MHQSALLFTLATVALGASTRVNTDINTNTDPNAVAPALNPLNPSALAAPVHRIVNINTDSAAARHPITVELGKSLDIDTDLLTQGKPTDVNVQKRLNLNVNTQQEGRKLINVDLNRRPDVNTELPGEDKSVVVNVSKRLDLNLDTTTPQQEHKVINVDLSRRLDVDANLPKQDKPADVDVAKPLGINADPLNPQENKPVDVNFAKHLDLNLDTTTTHQQTHKLINVDPNPLLNTYANPEVNANNQQTATTTSSSSSSVAAVNLARGRMPTALEVSRRHLDNVNKVDINSILAKEHKLATVDLGKRLDLNNIATTTLHKEGGEQRLITVDLGKRLDLNNIATTTLHKEGGEQRLITVDLGKRIDLNVGTIVPEQNEHKFINVDLNKVQKRNFQMSTGYVLNTAKVDTVNSQQVVVDAAPAAPAAAAAAITTKRDLNVNVKSELQHLSARSSKSLSCIYIF
jgi:hypothetical protein